MKTKPQLRVLHVVHSLEPGGMENGLTNLARALHPRGIETHVACLERRGAFADRLPRPEQVTILGKGGGFSPAAAWQLAREIRRLRPALLHTHNLGPLIYSALATGFGLSRPLLHGEHSRLTPEELQPRRLRQRRVLYGACRAIHTVSEDMRDELLSLGFAPRRVRAIANGVDLTRFAPGDRAAARARIGVPAEALLIGIVGRFGAYKGHERLLEAFDELAPDFPTLHLIMVGEGGPRTEAVAARRCASAFASRIIAAGFQPDPAEFYRALDLLCLPSTNEGMSNALLEAMACGVPALAHDLTAHAEIIDPGLNGCVADLSEAPALARALRPLLADPARLAALGRAAREKVAARFDFASMADAYEALYRELAAA